MSNFKFWIVMVILCFAFFGVALLHAIIQENKNEELIKNTEKKIQLQAISNNFAHWEVNLSGEVTFKWNVQTNNVGKE